VSNLGRLLKQAGEPSLRGQQVIEAVNENNQYVIQATSSHCLHRPHHIRLHVLSAVAWPVHLSVFIQLFEVLGSEFLGNTHFLQEMDPGLQLIRIARACWESPEERCLTPPVRDGGVVETEGKANLFVEVQPQCNAVGLVPNFISDGFNKSEESQPSRACPL
jgi:hypothetical protein